MKKYQRKLVDQEVFEFVIPIGGTEAVEALYDDCLICQELKREMAAGRVREVGEEGVGR